MADNQRPADAPPETDFVNPIAGQGIGGADWRITMLRPLVDAGVITYDQMFEIVDVTNETTSEDEVFARVSGQFNKTGREIAAALTNTPFARSAESIDEKKRTFGEWASAHGGAESFGMLDVTAEGRGGIGWDAITGWTGRNIPTEEEQAVLADRKSMANRDMEKLIDIIDKAEDTRYFTSDQATEARIVARQFGNAPEIERYENDAFAVLKDLQGRGFDTNIVAELETVAPDERVEPDAPAELPEYASRAGRYLDPEVRAQMETERTDAANLSTATMAGVLAALGAEENKLALMTPGQLDVLGLEQDEEGQIWDRSKGVLVESGPYAGTVVGVEMSLNQYEILREREDFQEAYGRAAMNTTALQEMLDLPFFSGEGPQMPVEDIAFPSLDPTRPFEIPAYTYDGRTSSAAELGSMSSRQRRMLGGIMARGEFFPGDYNDDMYWENDTPLDMMSFADPYQPDMLEAWDMAKQASALHQVDPIHVLTQAGRRNRAATAAERRRLSSRGGGGGGGRGPTYSVPASLREIPDYKTLAERTRTVFSDELGRDMEDWELELLADQLKGKYEERNKERIKVHKESWLDAVNGGSTDVDFTEIEEPLEGMAYDVGEKYAAEIDRGERVEDRAVNRQLLMNSISIGERMI